ncbi:unnamed protein product [Boreogadus saida]
MGYVGVIEVVNEVFQPLFFRSAGSGLGLGDAVDNALSFSAFAAKYLATAALIWAGVSGSGGGVEVDAAVGQPGSVEAGTGVRLQGEALVVEGFAAQGLQNPLQCLPHRYRRGSIADLFRRPQFHVRTVLHLVLCCIWLSPHTLSDVIPPRLPPLLFLCVLRFRSRALEYTRLHPTHFVVRSESPFVGDAGEA